MTKGKKVLAATLTAVLTTANTIPALAAGNDTTLSTDSAVAGIAFNISAYNENADAKDKGVAEVLSDATADKSAKEDAAAKETETEKSTEKASEASKETEADKKEDAKKEEKTEETEKETSPYENRYYFNPFYHRSYEKSTAIRSFYTNDTFISNVSLKVFPYMRKRILCPF